ncbi:hypothetical protein [Companilactobacillus mishanensis]|uniref:hypothetical protein n=1 Tax=Companilactobacillus mishanensis TaxID=2486008 RepID=UPI00129509DC|nr:hypothetical protein [Companilactobacillus mishanensis]MQS90112.1 hypothetical protein [Companilactobacillus mishanensis]
MKKSTRTLVIASAVVLAWIPAAEAFAVGSSVANADVVGTNNNNSKVPSFSNIENNGRKNDSNSTPKNNNDSAPKNNNVSTNNNIPANTNKNSNAVGTSNNNSNKTAGLSNVQNLASGSVVNLSGPSGFVYTLFNSSGTVANRGLAGDTAWVSDKSATDSNGNTYYRVSTDEWVKQASGVTLN